MQSQKRKADALGVFVPNKTKKFKKIPPGLQQKIRREVRKGREINVWDQRDTISVDNTGTIIDITATPQGTTDLTRIGDEYYLLSVQVRFNLVIGDTRNNFRVLIAQFTGESGNNSVTKNLQSGSVSAGYGTLAPYSQDYRKNRRILFDKTYDLDTDDPAFTDTAYITQGFIDRKVGYISGGTSGFNHLFLIVISDSGAPTHPICSYNTRVRFTDS